MNVNGKFLRNVMRKKGEKFCGKRIPLREFDLEKEAPETYEFFYGWTFNEAKKKLKLQRRHDENESLIFGFGDGRSTESRWAPLMLTTQNRLNVLQ